MTAPELVTGYVVAGKYAIRSLLLHGGATASYRALAPQNRDVVVKLYDSAILSHPDVMKALAQHKSIGAKLPIKQIIPIAESGTDPNSGAPFTVSDFETSPSLAQLIDRGPLAVSDLMVLVRNLARATDLLHANDITTLSLHPTNVFVRPSAQYQVRIADFGASLVRSALPVPEKAGRWMPWLAPEQIKGQVAPTPTVDIFALALLAFFAVTGRSYWRSSQAKMPDTAALRREILGERMPASVRAGEFSITLNPAVDVVFARALAFRPADRYATAAEFVAGLDAAISGAPVARAETDAALAPAPGAARLAPPPPRKMPLRTTMVGLGSAAAAVAKEASSAKPPTPPVQMAVPTAPAVAVAPAVSREPAPMAPPRTPTARGGPPPLPMAPPPAQLEAVLARFEAPPEPKPVAPIAASSIENAGIVNAWPASPAPQQNDYSPESVQTDVAVIGETIPDTPKNSRLRWVVSLSGLLVIAAGAAVTVSGRRTSVSRVSEPDTSMTTSAPPPPAAVEETVVAEPIAPAVPPPAPAADPPLQADDDNAAAPAPVADTSTEAPALPSQAGPATPPSQSAKKPCGKFLKRCK